LDWNVEGAVEVLNDEMEGDVEESGENWRFSTFDILLKVNDVCSWISKGIVFEVKNPSLRRWL